LNQEFQQFFSICYLKPCAYCVLFSDL